MNWFERILIYVVAMIVLFVLMRMVADLWMPLGDLFDIAPAIPKLVAIGSGLVIGTYVIDQADKDYARGH